MATSTRPLAFVCNRTFLRTWVFVAAVVFAARAQAADYDVAPGGSDTASGQTSAPWLTIQHAFKTVKAGDTVTRGQRVGLIKFGSRTDVLFGPEWEITVRPGQRVAGGSSIIARRLDRKS